MSNFESHSFLDTESNTFAATLYEQRRYAKLPKESRFEEGCFRRTFYVLEIRATLELALQSISRCCRHRDKTTCAIAPSRENFQVDCLWLLGQPTQKHPESGKLQVNLEGTVVC